MTGFSISLAHWPKMRPYHVDTFLHVRYRTCGALVSEVFPVDHERWGKGVVLVEEEACQFVALFYAIWVRVESRMVSDEYHIVSSFHLFVEQFVSAGAVGAVFCGECFYQEIFLSGRQVCPVVCRLRRERCCEH